VKIALASVPTSSSWLLPSASGRSVTLRIASTGLPSAGPSSCSPPLSVRIRVERTISRTIAA
jgi:hypothetical protein